MDVSFGMFCIIFGGMIVTIIPRVFPLVFLSKINLPDWALRWLNHIPAAIMAALLAQELLLPTEEFPHFWNNLRLLAAIPAFLIAITTRSLLGTVIAGILSMMILRNFV